jgi:bacterial/archaeal transporter family-2 protein
MNSYTAIFICIVTGAAIPLQGAINSRLAGIAGSTYLVGGISALVAAVLMLSVYILTSDKINPNVNFAQIPAYLWLGGVFAFIYLMATILAIPKIGVSSAIILLIAGQIIAALLMDYFGILTDQKQIQWNQWIGVVLVMFGTVLFKVKINID